MNDVMKYLIFLNKILIIISLLLYFSFIGIFMFEKDFAVIITKDCLLKFYCIEAAFLAAKCSNINHFVSKYVRKEVCMWV